MGLIALKTGKPNRGYEETACCSQDMACLRFCSRSGLSLLLFQISTRNSNLKARVKRPASLGSHIAGTDRDASRLLARLIRLQLQLQSGIWSSYDSGSV